MREQQLVFQTTFVDLRPKCDDCQIATDLRSMILDPRDGRQIAVYQCSIVLGSPGKTDHRTISGGLGGGRPYSLARFAASFRYEAACSSNCDLKAESNSLAASPSSCTARSRYSVSSFMGFRASFSP